MLSLCKCVTCNSNKAKTGMLADRRTRLAILSFSTLSHVTLQTRHKSLACMLFLRRRICAKKWQFSLRSGAVARLIFCGSGYNAVCRREKNGAFSLIRVQRKATKQRSGENAGFWSSAEREWLLQFWRCGLFTFGKLKYCGSDSVTWLRQCVGWFRNRPGPSTRLKRSGKCAT